MSYAASHLDEAVAIIRKLDVIAIESMVSDLAELR
jgi:hypothetical protein